MLAVSTHFLLRKKEERTVKTYLALDSLIYKAQKVNWSLNTMLIQKPDMYRIGLILPSSNTTMEPEFNRIVSTRATVHSARIRLRQVTSSELEAMERETECAAVQLSDSNVDIICYGCTSGSLFRGLGHDKEIVRRIEKETQIPAVATAGAVVEALRTLGIEKVSVATPYTKEIEILEDRFLRDNDFEVVNIDSLGLARNLDIGLQEPHIAYALAKKVCTSASDGVFISCTNFRTVEVIERLETELGKPIISSNTATAWKSLRLLGVTDSLPGYGKLLLSD